jgi:hypothetical protein
VHELQVPVKELLVILLLALATSELGAQDGRDPLSICRRLYLDCDRDRSEWLAQGSACVCPEAEVSTTESAPLKLTKESCSEFLDEQEVFVKKRQGEMEMELTELVNRQAVLADKLEASDSQRKASEERAAELYKELVELQMVVEAQRQVIEEMEMTSSETSSRLEILSPECPSQPPCVCNATAPVCQCQWPEEVRCVRDPAGENLLRDLTKVVDEAMREDRARNEDLLAALRSFGESQDSRKEFHAVLGQLQQMNYSEVTQRVKALPVLMKSEVKGMRKSLKSDLMKLAEAQNDNARERLREVQGARKACELHGMQDRVLSKMHEELNLCRSFADTQLHGFLKNLEGEDCEATTEHLKNLENLLKATQELNRGEVLLVMIVMCAASLMINGMIVAAGCWCCCYRRCVKGTEKNVWRDASKDISSLPKREEKYWRRLLRVKREEDKEAAWCKERAQSVKESEQVKEQAERAGAVERQADFGQEAASPDLAKLPTSLVNYNADESSSCPGRVYLPYPDVDSVYVMGNQVGQAQLSAFGKAVSEHVTVTGNVKYRTPEETGTKRKVTEVRGAERPLDKVLSDG